MSGLSHGETPYGDQAVPLLIELRQILSVPAKTDADVAKQRPQVESLLDQLDKLMPELGKEVAAGKSADLAAALAKKKNVFGSMKRSYLKDATDTEVGYRLAAGGLILPRIETTLTQELPDWYTEAGLWAESKAARVRKGFPGEDSVTETLAELRLAIRNSSLTKLERESIEQICEKLERKMETQGCIPISGPREKVEPKSH